MSCTVKTTKRFELNLGTGLVPENQEVFHLINDSINTIKINIETFAQCFNYNDIAKPPKKILNFLYIHIDSWFQKHAHILCSLRKKDRGRFMEFFFNQLTAELHILNRYRNNFFDHRDKKDYQASMLIFDYFYLEIEDWIEKQQYKRIGSMTSLPLLADKYPEIFKGNIKWQLPL